MDWIISNKDWLFSGLGVSIAFTLITWVFNKKNRTDNLSSPETGTSITINNQNNSTIDTSPKSPSEHPSQVSTRGAGVANTLEAFKNSTHILFIDDDIRFKVVKILTKSGWVHTKLVKDAETLDDNEIRQADILFIDVQGVGLALGFNDEGLGLALAIKDKYPLKKVVIYSAETKGDRFHAALRKADSFLPKNADPYEFQKIVEDFTIGSKDVSA